MSFADGLVIAGNTAVAMYRDGEASFLRRSTDGGTSWQAPVWLSSNAPGGAYDHAIAAYGSFVDVVFAREGRIRYRRSIDAGASFAASVALSAKGADAANPVVAHGPGGVVAIAWGNEGVARVRVSTNNGISFASAVTIATSADIWLDDPLEIAVGDGVIYVAYYLDWARLRLKRSLDGGITWSAAFTVSNQADAGRGLDIAVSGSRAYVAFASSTVWFSTIDYRRSVDKGGSWTGPLDLSPPAWTTAFGPHLLLRAGVLRAAFTTCHDNGDYCDPNTAWYSQSSDGFTWTTPLRASPTSFEEGEAAGVGHAGKPIVLFSGWREIDEFGAWVRSRLP